MRKADILCWTETLKIEEPETPSYLQDSHEIKESSNVVKEEQKGRGSGGITVLTKKYIISETIERKNTWMFMKISANTYSFILGVVYTKTDPNDDVIIEQLEQSLHHLEIQGHKENIIIGGDFKARISDLNQLDNEILENTSIWGQRTVCDQKLEPRGA